MSHPTVWQFRQKQKMTIKNNPPRVRLSPRLCSPASRRHLEALKFIKRDLNKPISHATSRGALGFYPKIPAKCQLSATRDLFGSNRGPRKISDKAKQNLVRLFDVQNNNKQVSLALMLAEISMLSWDESHENLMNLGKVCEMV